MRRLFLLAALTFASPVLGFTAQNELRIEPTAEGFAVNWHGGRAGATDFWCAAGDYAVRGLNLAPATIIYRTSEPPRRSGQPMHFSLNPARAASSSGVAVLGADDAGFTVGAAQAFCEIRTHRR